MYALVLELVGKDGRWELHNREIRIGRDPNCDLVLPTGDYPMVSRSHLLIRLVADRYWVEDLNTPGGTFVNGAQVQVSPLSDGDVLRLGASGPELRASIVPSFRLSGESPEGPARRQSASQEDPTWSNRGITDETVHGAVIDQEVIPSASFAGQPVPETVPPLRPGTEEGLPAAAPEVPAGQTTLAAGPDASAADQAVPVRTPAAPAAVPAPPEVTTRKTGPAKSTPGAPANGAPQPAAAVKSSEASTLEQKLKTIRNMMIVALLLIIALWFVVLYHMR